MGSHVRGRLALGLAGVSALGLLGMVGCTGARAAGGGGELVASVSPAERIATLSGVHVNAPTFYADVLPILAENCVDCHQPQGKNMGGMVAPFSLATYEVARPWARVMALRVKEGTMPPWHPHPMHKGTFVGERYLSDADKNTIAAWAEAGAPAGDPAETPAQTKRVLQTALAQTEEGREWWIGEPDIVLGFAEPYFVDDEIRDLNVTVNVVIPEDFTEPRWIKANEMQAGSQHVHHICGEPFGCIAPGWDPYVYPEGYAMLLPPVREIGLGMHYNKPPGEGTGFHDTSRAAAIFYKDGETIRHIVRREVLSVGNNFVIPAGHPSYQLTREFVFEEESLILSLTPHMHYRGSQAKYELVYPDGSLELILWVPKYDFEWQRMYIFQEPKRVPAGTKLLWTPTWNNSAENIHNPDPTIDVPYGAPTEMEMGNGWLDWTLAQPIEHVVGRDPIPQEVLDEVTQMLNDRAARSGVRVIDNVRETPR
jgi:cytochrome c551/c552